MKKFLLFAAAALVAVSANAQLSNRSLAGKPQSRTAVQSSVQQKKFEVAGMKDAQATLSGYNRLGMGKMVAVTAQTKQLLTPARQFQSNAPRRAGAVQPVYYAVGNDISEGAVSWEMQAGTFEDGSLCLIDVIPNAFEFEGGVPVEYTLSGDSAITIQPQLVASSEEKGWFIYLVDGTSASGEITLYLGEDGSLSSDGSFSALYAVFSTETFDPEFGDTYLGNYEYVQSIKYALPGQLVIPTATAEPSSLVLFAGLGVSGYHYTLNYAFTSAYAPMTFRNSTIDRATEWSWSVDKDDEVITSTDKNFTIDIEPGTYTAFKQVAKNETAVSDTTFWGCRQSLSDEGEIVYDSVFVFGGGFESEFEFTDGTYATITRQNPDGDLTFYTNWGTPDKTNTSMSKIYVYHDKPAAPLYIEGITLPIVAFEVTDKIKYRKNPLHISIYECSRTMAGRLTLGDLIAEGDAPIASIVDEYKEQSGLTAVNFTDLYVLDELGMSQTVDHLFIDSEFVVVIENWDSGLFTGVLGSQDVWDDNDLISTWFEQTDEPGSMYRYASWKCKLFVGLLGAACGYLNTEDDTNINLPTEGGEASIHIDPMLYSSDENDNPATRLFLEDNFYLDGNYEEPQEQPEWLELLYTNPDAEAESSEFDLIVRADALPEGVEGRTAEFTVWQEGAKLDIKVVQGTDTGITTVTATRHATGKLYNLAGQNVKTAKGIVISNGRKFINK